MRGVHHHRPARREAGGDPVLCVVLLARSRSQRELSVKRARAVGVLALIALACCSTYGADPDPTLAPDRDAGATSDGASSPGDSGASAVFDGGAVDADAGEAGDAAPVCALFKVGDNCSAASQCCSSKCNEARQCADTCKNAATICDPTSTTGCCVGLWCSAGACSACILAGQSAGQTSGFPTAASCCSRTIDVNGKCK